MAQHICKQCKNLFKHKSTKRIFCSKECFHKFRVGKAQSEVCIEKRRRTMIGRTYSAERRANIGIAGLRVLSDSELTKMKELLELGMPDCFVQKALPLNTRVYKRYKQQLYPNGIPWQCKWLERDIEPEIVVEIVRMAKNRMAYRTIASQTKIYHKTVKLILTNLGKRDKDIQCLSTDDGVASMPEGAVRDLLRSNNIEHTQEFKLPDRRKYRFDFHIKGTNLLLEVQGDYWHCSSRKYPNGPINTVQTASIKRDLVKKELANNLGYVVIPIWEHDIVNNIQNVEKTLKEWIKKCKIQ